MLIFLLVKFIKQLFQFYLYFNENNTMSRQVTAIFYPLMEKSHQNKENIMSESPVKGKTKKYGRENVINLCAAIQCSNDKDCQKS